MCDFKITVAGTGYVGLNLAVLLVQHNHVFAENELGLAAALDAKATYF